MDADNPSIGILTDSDQPVYLLPGTATRTQAIQAQKGAGKSYLAGVLEECLTLSGVPWVVLDPMGVHWSIRLDGDMRRPWKPAQGVVIIGGEHGDIEIQKDMGSALARVVVERGLSAVVDLSQQSKSTWRTFVRDFCITLYEVNRTPRHVFIEEAPEFVPQTQPYPEMRQCYEAVERMARLGRGRGIGITLITQRAATVSKNVLELTDTLYVMRTTGRNDARAIMDTIEPALAPEHRERLPEFRQSLAGLPDGEGWVWCPQQKLFSRLHVRARETYHAGATPDMEPVGAIAPGPIDVKAIKAALEDAGAVKDPAPKPEPLRHHIEVGRKPERTVPAGEHDELAARFDAMAKKADDLQQEVDSLRALTERQKALNEEAERELAAARDLKRAFRAYLGEFAPGVTVTEPVLMPPGVSSEEIRRLVAEAVQGVSLNGHAPVLAPAPEVLRKKWQQKAVERLHAEIQALDPDSVSVLTFLLGAGAFRANTAIALGVWGEKHGSTRERSMKALQPLVSAGMVDKARNGEFKATLRDWVGRELAPHTPTAEDVEAVTNALVVEVARD